MRNDFQDDNNITIKRACIDDYENWDKFLESIDYSTFFHTAKWGKTLEKSSEMYKFLLILAKDESDLIVGGLPLIEIRHAPLISNLVSIPEGHGGVICQDRTIFKNLCNFNFSISSCMVKLNLSNYHNIDFETYRSAGFNCYSNGYSYFIDLLLPMDEIWMKYRKETKNRIRKAMKSDVVIKEADTEEDLIVIEDLYKETMERTGGNLGLLKIIRTVYKERDSKNVKFLLAEHNGKIIAFFGNLLFNKSAYYWVGGSSTENLKYAPNNLLTHFSSGWLKANGFSYYCLGGSEIEDGKIKESLDNYKKGYGGDKMLSYGFVKILNPLGHAIETIMHLKKRRR